MNCDGPLPGWCHRAGVGSQWIPAGREFAMQLLPKMAGDQCETQLIPCESLIPMLSSPAGHRIGNMSDTPGQHLRLACLAMFRWM